MQQAVDLYTGQSVAIKRELRALHANDRSMNHAMMGLNGGAALGTAHGTRRQKVDRVPNTAQ